MHPDLKLTLDVLVAARRERLAGSETVGLHSDARVSRPRTASPDADGLQVPESPEAA